jgi:hypothetical protein
MAFDCFSKDVLKAQDGKRIPLKIGIDGPIIGEAVFRYEEDTGQLLFAARFDNSQVEAWLKDEVGPIKEREDI